MEDTHHDADQPTMTVPALDEAGATPPEDFHTRKLVLVLVALVVALLLGAIFVWGQQAALLQVPTPDEPGVPDITTPALPPDPTPPMVEPLQLPPVSERIDLEAIEEDLEATDLDAMEAKLEVLQEILNDDAAPVPLTVS